jgi:hypothetical protein
MVDPGETVPLVVGSSGAGKSTLLKVLVEPRLRERIPGLRYHVIDDGYVDLRNEVAALVPAPGSDGHAVIVLDQFEQWLAYVNLQAPSDRDPELAWMKRALGDAQRAANYTLVLSLRDEWYYHLRFLEDLVPSPLAACGIQGPQVTDDSDEMRQEIFGSFKRVVKGNSPPVAEDILRRLGPTGPLSPLQAQIVGAVVERHRRDHPVDTPYFDDVLGGVDGAVDAYFKGILEGTEHRAICHKILCALSVKTRFREQAELHTILETLFEERAAVEEAVDYLVDQGLLIEHEEATYELAHDYLAEFFTGKSAAELHPVERDNIRVHVESGSRPNANVLLGDELGKAPRRQLGRPIAAVLSLLMVVRLLSFGIDWTPLGRSVARPVEGQMLDTSYILVMVPHMAWIWYIAVFYDRVFVRLNESPLARAYSVFVLLDLFACIAVGMVIPSAWLLAIAAGGITFGLKLLLLARRRDMSRAARERLRGIGGVALGNLLGVGILGLVDLLSFRYVDSGKDVTTWLIVNIVLSAMMTYWCLVLRPTHTSRSGISQILGLMGRPGPVLT